MCRKSTFGIAVTSVLLIVCACVTARADFTPLSGQAMQADGWLTATTRTVAETPVAADANDFTIRGKTGTLLNDKGNEIGGMSIAFLDADDKTVVDADGKPMNALTLRASDLKLYGSETVYPDAYIQISRMRYYVRPNLFYYSKDEFKKLTKTWDSLPKASEHVFTVELRRDDSGKIGLWFDGNFMDEYAPATFAKMRVTLQPGAGLQELTATKSTFAPLLTLPVQENSRVQGMEDAKINFDPKQSIPDAFQKLSGSVKGIAVDGLSVFTDMVNSDLQSYYFRRTAADNLPEQRMFTVPLETYDDAYVLAATENDPTKLNAFTLRVTRYGRSRGNAMADTIVQIPAADAKDTEAARRVGTVSYTSKGATKNATLWLLKVPIKNGLIQDLLYNDDKKSPSMGTDKYLDVELMNPLSNVTEAESFPPPMGVTNRAYRPENPDYNGYDFYNIKPPAHGSNVHVFGVALEKSAAQMRVNSNIGIQAFYTSDKPQFEAKVTAEKSGDYSVTWKYADINGNVVNTGTKAAKLQAGEKSTIAIPVDAGSGWYAAQFILKDAAQNTLVDYRTSFAMLPPDTRKAGLESPFYGWWFGTNHGDDIQLDDIGPLFKRLGIRRADGSGRIEFPESESLPKYGFTHSTIPWTSKGQGRQTMAAFMNGTQTLQQAIDAQESAIRETLKEWPSIDRMLVFHESSDGGAPFPTEIWGEPASNPEGKDKEKWDKYWPKTLEYLTAMAKMVRANFPQLKMQYGNSGNSMNLVGELFRQKFPRKYIDTVASEDLGQTIAPERDTLGSTQDGWYLRELTQKMGYGDVPITATIEWIGRMVESSRPHGLREQAEWKVRDGLLALAYGYDTISIAGINDASDAYYYSIWANGGLNTRYPIMAPKPAYAAIATLTQVLDQAKYVRFVPTGSTVCYLEEFQRGDKWVYVLWTPRGERDLSLTFNDDASRTLTDLYGRDSNVTGKNVSLKASTAAQYLVSATKLLSVNVGKSTFTEDQSNVPAKPLQTIALDNASEISVAPDKTKDGKTDIAYSSPRTMVEGNAIVRQVNDPEMGKCIEIDLQPNSNLKPEQIEYVTLNLAKPVQTDAKNAGLWIKGNGSWGAVDILKNHWGPWADNGNLNMSWSGAATLNFDGWNRIVYPYYDWVHDTGTYATTTVSGLRITFPRSTLVGTERVPIVNQKIRIKGIELW